MATNAQRVRPARLAAIPSRNAPSSDMASVGIGEAAVFVVVRASRLHKQCRRDARTTREETSLQPERLELLHAVADGHLCGQALDTRRAEEADDARRVRQDVPHVVRL